MRVISGFGGDLYITIMLVVTFVQKTLNISPKSVKKQPKQKWPGNRQNSPKIAKNGVNAEKRVRPTSFKNMVKKNIL